MISKIIHYEKYISIPDINYGVFLKELTRYYQINEDTIIQTQNKGSDGTLGVVSRIELNGKIFFIKTHRPTSFHKKNLDKEYFFLEKLYGDILDLRKIQVMVDGFQHSVIIMDELQAEDSEVSLEEKISFLDGLRKNINACSIELEPFRAELVRSGFNVAFLLKKALWSIDFLYKKNFISSRLKNRLKKTISSYTNTGLSECFFCHGDLGNKNIMLKNGQRIVIDWEDAMLGTEKFDLCYWLSFMSQRKYYQSEYFKKFIYDDSDTLFFIVTVLILKGYLSVIDGSIHTNKITIQDRIEEIYDL